MLTYSKALELKNAGFPQPEDPPTGHYYSWVLKDTFGQAYATWMSGDMMENLEFKQIQLFPGMMYARTLVYIPTLEELIKECEDGFYDLSKHRNGTWGCNKSECCLECNPEGWDDWETNGESPEEAVSNLYLALHK